MSARAKKLVKFGSHTVVVDEIIAFRVDQLPPPYEPTTVVWLRTHHGQWSLAEKGDYSALLNAALLADLPGTREAGMKRVIIESPYAGDVERNGRYLVACMRDSLKRGEAPYASHRLYPGVLDDDIPEERELGIEAGLVWGQCAELTAVYVDLTGVALSSGMRRGIERARIEGRPIEMRSLGGEWSTLPARTWLREDFVL